MSMARPPSRQGAALAPVLCAWLIAACAAPSPHETVLELWAMGREGEVVTELMPEFERAHPGIRVRVQQLPWTAAHEKLLTAFVGGSTPDVAQLGNTWIPEFAALGALAALEPAVAGSTIVQQDDYFSGIWETNRFEDGLYGVPWYIDTRLLFYRRDLLAGAGFSTPPQGWAQWMEMLVALKQRAGPAGYAILLPLNEFEPLLALALQQEDALLREDGRWGNFRGPGFGRALEFYLEMFRRDLAPVATNTQISNVWDEFGRGYFGFYISGPWNIGEFKRRLPAEQQDRWMTAPLPGPDGPGASIAGGASLVVFERSPRKQAAWKLIEYLARPEVQLRFYALTGNLPPRRSTWSEPRLADDVHARAFRDQLERVKPAPKVPEWERIVTEMRLVAEQAVHGQLTVDAAAAELDARADRILEKRRWILAQRNAR